VKSGHDVQGRAHAIGRRSVSRASSGGRNQPQ
jgi:hypothetical protein